MIYFISVWSTSELAASFRASNDDAPKGEEVSVYSERYQFGSPKSLAQYVQARWAGDAIDWRNALVAAVYCGPNAKVGDVATAYWLGDLIGDYLDEE